MLCLGAHSDDIEIGCGATLLHLKKLYAGRSRSIGSSSAHGCPGEEAGKAAELFTAGCDKKVVLKNFRTDFFPMSGKK